MFRRAALFAAAAAATAMAVPALAAPKAATYYFANTGSCGTEAPAYQLVTAPPSGMECGATLVVVQGTGITASEVYTTPKVVKGTVDVSRPLTGTIYIGTSIHGAIEPSMPGYAKATVSIKIDSTTIGSVLIEGTTSPAAFLKKDISLKIPASLKNKAYKKVSATVVWDTAAGGGATLVSYTEPNQSVLRVPVR